MTDNKEKDYKVTDIRETQVLGDSGKVVSALIVSFTIPEFSNTFTVQVSESTPRKIKQAIDQKVLMLREIKDL